MTNIFKPYKYSNLYIDREREYLLASIEFNTEPALLPKETVKVKAKIGIHIEKAARTRLLSVKIESVHSGCDEDEGLYALDGENRIDKAYLPLPNTAQEMRKMIDEFFEDAQETWRGYMGNLIHASVCHLKDELVKIGADVDYDIYIYPDDRNIFVPNLDDVIIQYREDRDVLAMKEIDFNTILKLIEEFMNG